MMEVLPGKDCPNTLTIIARQDKIPCDTFFVVKDTLYYKICLPVDTADNSRLYEVVETWIGTPYRKAGISTKGVDCSGFVKCVYEEVYNVELGHSSREMAKNTIRVKKSELKEGDLIFFKVRGSKIINHVAIYLKNGYFAHSSSSRGVMVDTLDSIYWKRCYYAAGRCME